MTDQTINAGIWPVQIYNSISRRKETLKPLVPGQLGIYVCGMTVYDYCHLGHARVLVVFDCIVRYLRSLGIQVRYVRNITDIDDKIIVRAQETNETIGRLTKRFIDAMHEDERLLNVLPPDREPRATEFIKEIIQLIERLEESGFAYQGTNGDLYYRVRKFPKYGQLSVRSLEQLKVGARVEPDGAKEYPLDFVLWKTWKPGEPGWESPWGRGRPGWHIECSAMSMKCLGEHFDIHAGGMDLQFPHHENEIAQSEAATGVTFANYWMHNGYVQVDREKMSKSLANFYTIREILTRDTSSERMGEVIRYMILSSHYRSPLNFSDESLANARASLTRLYLALEKVKEPDDKESMTIDSNYTKRFHQAMADDFNTPGALAVLFDLAREMNRLMDQGKIRKGQLLSTELMSLSGKLGLLNLEPTVFLGSLGNEVLERGSLTVEKIQQLVDERVAAREQYDWERADEIRKVLLEKGIVLEDTSSGSTKWRLDGIYSTE